MCVPKTDIKLLKSGKGNELLYGIRAHGIIILKIPYFLGFVSKHKHVIIIK